ncbi:MAG TPA: glycoside hydrolase family 57 protein [Steroidobacteraceae bacterium]|nr:glycoside hydrolase family 57 protein [Steroidobacteraceae bacterium]
MTPPHRLPVVLLWHMHQPQYRDSLTGQYVLPWTYLHAIKDYTDMAVHLEQQPRARAVVNFTPILLEQLEDLASRIAAHLERGEPLPDPVLALLGAAPLPSAGSERERLIRACLRAHRKNMIERFGAYLELATLAETLATAERAIYASDRLIRDLAVWYHIAWMAETVRRSDQRIAALTEQGRDFTDAQRRELLTIVHELVASVIPRFKRLQDEGRCELSITPYSHPILPLLLDFHAARESTPGAVLPRHPAYSGGAERAAWHLAEATRVFKRCFGTTPAGCWPSEGAVSTATLELIESAGFRWCASGGGVLRASLTASGAPPPATPDELDRAYRLPQGRLQCFFRDDRLADLIGFTYATWHGDDAARNLVHELEQLAAAGDNPDRVVLIALDGENAWEYYPFNGYYFLSALYSALSDHPALELTTLSTCIARGLRPVPLARVVAGSWVHGTLGTWMGDRDKNAAWDLLCEAKLAFDVANGAPRSAELADAAHRRACAGHQLALCESSDWFWWFGDYNPAEAVSQFDELYRHQLATLYRLLDRPVPESLSQPISRGRGVMEHGGVMRRALDTERDSHGA